MGKKIIVETGADRNLITYGESEILTTINKNVNIDLSVKELGHKETINIWEGLKRTIIWMRQYYG
jgi:nucleoside-diphosphate-sugar epimerase